MIFQRCGNVAAGISGSKPVQKNSTTLNTLILISASLALAGCSAAVDNTRAIELSRSVPVSATTFFKNVNTIIKEREYSYVTLAVAKPANKTQKSKRTSLIKEITTGSGFVVDKKGHVITAAHVGMAKGAHVAAAGPDGKTYRGRVIGLQRVGDMALIKLDNPDILTPVRPITNPCLAEGAAVLSLGKPGLQQDVARVGTLSKLRFGKPVRYRNFGYDEAMVLRLQTRRGESGGPVFDKSGALIGMLVSTLSTASGRYMDLAHAVPTPALGKFICSKTRCSANWRQLARKKLSACPVQPAKPEQT